MCTHILIPLEARDLTGADIIVMDQQYCFMPVKACDELLSYNSCKGNGSEEPPSDVLTAERNRDDSV